MSPSQSWQLANEDVHVWRVPLDQPVHEVVRLAALLDVAERHRAARFHVEHLTRQFTVARGVMRWLLAAYLDMNPADLSFRYGVKGKPALAGAGAARGLTFNLSHSGELALVAVGRGRALGVDVETVRPLSDLDAIARRYFCSTERAVLLAAEEHARLGWFYRFWTRKEALLKATGDGLSLPLDSIDVSGSVEGTARPMMVMDSTGVPRQLQLLDLVPGDGYAGALAAEGGGWQSQMQTWHPHLGA